MSEYKYQSPIEMIQGEMRMYMDGEILKAVQDVGVNVDKDELLKALAYDRDQYNKGYHDAEPKVGKWIEKDGMWCDDPTFRCSVCGEEYELLEGTPIDNGMNYCPNCCSRMFERRADE